MNELLSFAMPKFTLLVLFFKKPILLLTAVPAVAAVSLVVDFESMGWILFYFFMGDLVTGLFASYFVWKKSNPKERWFFGNGEGFSSDKAKKMGVKAMVYLAVPLLFIKIQTVLFIKNFKYDRISDAEFELATASLFLFCLIEGFSIFHENLPKCGFNLWQRIKKMIGFYKEIENQINK